MIHKVVITPSEKKNKMLTAYVVHSNNKRPKKIDFGDRNGSQYIDHKDPIKKHNYIARHQVNENWNDPLTAGFWSRYILWNKPTLESSIKDTEKIIDAPIYFVRALP